MNSPDRIFTSTNAMTKLATDDTIPKKLQECKVSAVRQAAALADAYAREGIREDLVNTVMEKKIDLILNAQTVQEVRRAASLPKPRFTGAEWVEDPFTVPEEELILWSRASLPGVLTSYGRQRFQALFKQIFGQLPSEAAASA